MCSKPRPGIAARPTDEDVAVRLGSIIDELAAVAAASSGQPGSDLAGRLAAAWALIAEADPELAERTARYTR